MTNQLVRIISVAFLADSLGRLVHSLFYCSGPVLQAVAKKYLADVKPSAFLAKTNRMFLLQIY